MNQRLNEAECRRRGHVWDDGTTALEQGSVRLSNPPCKLCERCGDFVTEADWYKKPKTKHWLLNKILNRIRRWLGLPIVIRMKAFSNDPVDVEGPKWNLPNMVEIQCLPPTLASRPDNKQVPSHWPKHNYKMFFLDSYVGKVPYPPQTIEDWTYWHEMGIESPVPAFGGTDPSPVTSHRMMWPEQRFEEVDWLCRQMELYKKCKTLEGFMEVVGGYTFNIEQTQNGE